MKKGLLFFLMGLTNKYYYLLETKTNKLIYKQYDRNKLKKLFVKSLLLNCFLSKNIYETNKTFTVINDNIAYDISNNNDTINYYINIKNDFKGYIKIFNNQNNDFNYMDLNYNTSSLLSISHDYNHNLFININNKIIFNNNKILILPVNCNNGFIIFNDYNICKNQTDDTIIITSKLQSMEIINDNKNLLIYKNNIKNNFTNLQLYNNWYEFTGYIDINQDIFFKLTKNNNIIPIKIFLYYYNYRYNFFYCLTDKDFIKLDNCKLFFINLFNFNEELFKCFDGNQFLIELKFLNYYKIFDLCTTIFNKIITDEKNINHLNNVFRTKSNDCNKKFIFNFIVGCSFTFFWVFQFFFHLYKNLLFFFSDNDKYIFHYFIFKNIFFSVVAIFISQSIVMASYILLAKFEDLDNYNLFIDNTFFIFLIILQFLNTILHFFSWIKYLIDYYQKDFFFIDLDILEIQMKEIVFPMEKKQLINFNKPFIIQLNSLSKIKALIYMYLQNNKEKQTKSLEDLFKMTNKYLTNKHKNFSLINYNSMLMFLLNIDYIKNFTINNSFYKYIITQDQLFILKNYILNTDNTNNQYLKNSNIKKIIIHNESFIGNSWLNELIVLGLNIFILTILIM